MLNKSNPIFSNKEKDQISFRMSIFLFFFIGILSLSACTDSNETDNYGQGGRDTTPSVNSDLLNSYSANLKSLIKTPEGDFRGISIGASLNEVKQMEDTSDIEEETQAYIEYMINFNPLESAEVQYHIEKSKVSKIEVNIYPKNKSSQDSMYLELEKYFNERYNTKGVDKDSFKSWEIKDNNLNIILSKKDAQKVHDIGIIFYPGDPKSAHISQ